MCGLQRNSVPPESPLPRPSTPHYIPRSAAHTALWHGTTVQFVVANELNWRIVLSMRYTPAQMKEALEITEETLRHWRKGLSPLRGKRGYAPCFSPGDLLALKVVTQLHRLGMGIRQLQPVADDLFKACSQGVWSSVENKVLVFDGQNMDVVTIGDEGRWAQRVRIAVPLKPLIEQLQQRLSEEEVLPSQPEIVFPPFGVAQVRSK